MENKIKLRVVEKEDLPFIHQLFNDREITSFWFLEPYLSMAKLEDYFEKNKDNPQIREFILHKGQERLGYVSLSFINYIHRNAEFAIVIEPAHQGNGYAKLATSLAAEYAFSQLNLHKLYLIVDPINEKAIHIYEKCGFEQEAVLKETFFVEGEYHDAMLMGMFQRDFVK